MHAAENRWQDWAIFVLGLWLALSPWALDYVDLEAASANAVFVGIALAIASHFGLSFDAAAEEWLNLAAGIWLLAAPFVLDFTAQPVATADCLAVGALVTLASGSAASLDKEIARRWHERRDRALRGH